MEDIRGKEIAMIFQDPMTSLNPTLTIERQISESLRLHLGMDKETAQQRVIELLEQVGIPAAEKDWGLIRTNFRVVCANGLWLPWL